MKAFTKKDWALLSLSVVITLIGLWYNQYLHATADQAFFPKPLATDEIAKLGNNDTKAVVIYPVFTQYAYSPNGFYDYYTGKCQTCTTVSMRPYGINPSYNTGMNGFEYLVKLNYPFVTDITVDKHPEILSDYDEIILLHNEYMTKKEFDAILSHKNVVYLYPNSMYAEISVDYSKYQMTLIRGHGYPEKSIANGFGYVTSSQWEYDTNCVNYKWKERPNGMGLSCFPEYLVTYDRNLLQTIKDYPVKVPHLIPLNTTNVNVSNIGFCDWNGNCTQKLDDKLKNNLP